MVKENSESWWELGLYSLFKSHFLLPSLALHLMAFYLALGAAALSVNPQTEPSIPIKLLEAGEGDFPDKSVGPALGPGGPRTLPKRGNPEIPRQSSGKLNAGSPENITSSKDSTPAPEVAPALPGPKVLADVPRPFAVTETSPHSLVQLPTKEPVRNLAPAFNPDVNQRSLTASKGVGEGEGIRALKDGAQIPGALKGGGTGAGPYGVARGGRDGMGTRGGGSGTGTGGGSYAGLSSPDLAPYLDMIKKRVQSVWKYPEGIPGRHLVYLSFVLDRRGDLLRVRVLESTDARLDRSATEAMKRASPFPPIPESLREIAGDEIGIRFNVDFGVKVAR
jgi:TonB family protein